MNKRMPKKTRDAMIEYAQSLAASYARAQCYTIANYTLEHNETIAERLSRDHRSADGALRAAKLMCEAGCAQETKAKKAYLFGEFMFEDGSILT